MHRPLLALLTLSAAAFGSLGAQAAPVTNGGFETDPKGASVPPGWMVTGTGVSLDQVFPDQGLYDVAFAASAGAANPGVLSQAIGTIAGRGYVLRFDLLDEAGSSRDSFRVDFGGFSALIAGDKVKPPGNLASLYTSELFSIPGSAVTGSSTLLSFEGLNAGPAGGVAFNLDEVSLAAVAVPEPASVATMGFALALWLGLSRRRSAALASVRRKRALCRTALESATRE